MHHVCRVVQKSWGCIWRRTRNFQGGHWCSKWHCKLLECKGFRWCYQWFLTSPPLFSKVSQFKNWTILGLERYKDLKILLHDSSIKVCAIDKINLCVDKTMALLQEIILLAIRANNIILLKILMSTMQSSKPNFVINII